MKKIAFLTILFVSTIYYSFAASCYPNGVTFSTQAEIDDFFYYDTGNGTVPIYCSEIGGNVIIEGNDINNLDGLMHLTKINGDLIIRNCPRLTSLEGLKNLESIDGKLEINNIDKQWTLYGLGSLTSIGSDLIIKNNEVLSTLTGGSFNNIVFPGLNNLTSIGGGIFIESNPLLTDFYGLSGVTSISGHISVKYNDTLDDISDLSGITTGVVAIRIVENPLLPNLDGLQNIHSTGGGILIENNSSLMDLSGLEGIQTIGWHLYIKSNENLQNLQGLGNLHSIGKEMKISDNPKLLNLSGLNNLQTVGELLEIGSNNLLNSLSALNNLTAIGGSLSIESNPQLQTLQGIDNIDYTTITFLSLRSDNQLSTCDVMSICNFLDNGGNASIIGNAIGCASIEQVQESCSPPECTALISPFNGEINIPLDAELTWDPVDDATGYKISIGTEFSPQWDLLQNYDVGNTNNYTYYQDYPCKSVIYVKITPYNEHGDQIDCSISQFTTVGASIELAGDVQICYGDTTQLHAYFNEGTIGWSPADYLSDNTIKEPLAFPDSTTTFAATVTDEFGCTATDSVTVVVLSLPDVQTNGSEYLCKDQCNGTVSVQDLGNLAPYSFLWSTGDTSSVINNLCPGTYSVTVTNFNGCTNTGEWTIKTLPDIEVTIENIVNFTDSTQGSINVTIDNTSRAYGIEWIGMNGLNFQSNEEDIDSLEAGCYQLTVWDSILGCSIDTIICIEDKTTVINDIYFNNNLVNIYPNPANNMIFFKTTDNSSNIKYIEILDSSGKSVFRKNGNISKLNVSFLENGMYFIKTGLREEYAYKKIFISR